MLLHHSINGGILISVVAKQQRSEKKEVKKVIDFRLITW
jgi:hypothetical protein